MRIKNKVTVIGASGFLGSQIATSFINDGFNVHCPSRDELPALLGDLGVVVYSAGYGVCSSFDNLSKVIEANVNVLCRILQECSYSKFIYISSTRLYMNSKESNELTNFSISSGDRRKAFNLTKILAEELCISKDNTYLLRPSNIYGDAVNSNLFLPSIVRDAIVNKKINMFVPKTYEKDYVSVKDVVYVIKNIITKECPDYRTYNVGSGKNTSAYEIANRIKNKIDCTIEWIPNDVKDSFPITNINKITDEFMFEPSNVLNDLDSMIDDFILAHENGVF